MSHYASVKTTFKDQASLVAALTEIFGAEAVKVHATPVKIRGWYDEQEAKGEACNIVVSRDVTKLHADIGFTRNADGTFAQHIDNMEDDAVEKLPQRYARAVAIKQAKLSGWTVKEETVGGIVKLSLSKWS